MCGVDPDRRAVLDRLAPVSGQRPGLLVLGGAGMLGHKLWQRGREHLDVRLTMRRAPPAPLAGLFDPARMLVGVDALRFETVVSALEAARPDVVVNAIGLVKQRDEACDPAAAIQANALFPHLLARETARRGLRLVHVSTDCVFSGRRGGYREGDEPDPADLYGRSKLLGEVTGPGCLTLRTSFIGRELLGARGLVEWFLSQRGHRIAGYSHAVFSGLTTVRFADLLVTVIARHASLQGLYHVGGPAISKRELLSLLARAYAADVEIDPTDEPRLDRSLDSRRFWAAVGLAPPGWPEMAAELAADETPYEVWRSR